MFTELVPGIAMRLLHPVGVRNDKFRIVMARGLAPRGHLLAICHRERSVAILAFVITSVAK